LVFRGVPRFGVDLQVFDVNIFFLCSQYLFESKRVVFALHTMKIECVLTLLASAVAIVSATGMVPTPSPSVIVNKDCYHVGEDIEVSFVDGDPHPQDWVAIYEGNANPQNLAPRALLWLYTCGDQHCTSSTSSGTLTFGSGHPIAGSRGHFPLPAGEYKAILARNLKVPYDALAVSQVFSISATSCDISNTIIDALEDKGNFQTLLAALAATGLDVALKTAGPFTLFAPNDDAFAALGADTIAFLLANLEVLTDILLYHVVAGQVLSSDLVDGSVTTLNTDDIHVDVRSNGNIVINGNTLVVNRDCLASNGVIHEINKVLVPPSHPAPVPTPSPSKVPAPSPSIATDKDCYHVGEDINVSFLADGDAHPLDFVAIYESTADTDNLGRTLLWLYSCGDQHCNFAIESGFLTFGSGPPSEGSRAHFPLPAGHYKSILARGTHRPYEALAVSDVFSINTSRHPCA
jgi:uncharacterized surface protein with fasciclin (FAS1) repeats